MNREVALRYLLDLHLPHLVPSFGCSVRTVPIRIIGARNPSLYDSSYPLIILVLLLGSFFRGVV